MNDFNPKQNDYQPPVRPRIYSGRYIVEKPSSYILRHQVYLDTTCVTWTNCDDRESALDSASDVVLYSTLIPATVKVGYPTSLAAYSRTDFIGELALIYRLMCFPMPYMHNIA